MKKKPLLLILCAVALLVLAAGGLWHTRPITLADILGHKIVSVSCALMDPYTTTGVDGANYYHYHVTDLDAEADSEAMTALLAEMGEHPLPGQPLGALPPHSLNLPHPPGKSVHLLL